MKKEKTFGKFLVGVLSFALAFALTFSFVSPMSVEAKTKSITLKAPKGGNKMFWPKNVNKTAKAVKKGSYHITTVKNGYTGEGFLKFTAPKTKTYTFTVSNLYAPNDEYANGYLAIMKKNFSSSVVVSFQDVKTKSGKKNSINFATEDQLDGEPYYKVAYGKYKIKKGETVYLYFSASGTNSDAVTLDLNIK